MKEQKGYAAILIIFVLGMVSVFIGLSLIQTGYGASIMGRSIHRSNRAFYAAQSGVEEALYQIGQDIDYGVSSPATFQLPVGTGQADVTVSGTNQEKTIRSVGTDGLYARVIEVEVQNTSVQPGFDHAVHAGQGGFELEHNTVLTGKDDTKGNVFSNHFIKAAKNDFDTGTGECKNAASKIDGSVWAVNFIGKLAENDTGPCIVDDAYANELNYCYVNGVPYSPQSPLASCLSANAWTNEPAPTPIPLPDMGVERLKNYLTNKGDVFDGNCILDGSGDQTDCSNGTGTIGNLIITGNLEKPSNRSIAISGPIWVQGNAIFNSQGDIRVSPEITDISQLIVVDGTIQSDSNIAFVSNESAYLLFITTYTPENPDPLDEAFCDTPAISLSSNTESVLFYSVSGCLTVTANSAFHGAILGEKIVIRNNSTVEYDPALGSTIFGLTSSGGWQVISFLES